VEAIATYQSPLFTLGEFALVAAVVYHALNGIRIVIFDYRPRLWKHQGRAALYVLGLSVVICIPAFIIMFGHVLDFYNEGHPVLGLVEVIVAQLPFVVGFAVAIIAALVFAAITSVIIPARPQTGRPRGSGLEKFWWSYMRVSGVIILPLVFGHLAMQHLIQGVFDITAAGHTVVGSDLVNQTGTSVEFVANRWNMLVAGVAIWRVYDFALLALAVVHGFNGLRYILTDYTMKQTILRRASIYLCVIAAVVLLMLGAGALLSTISQSAIDIAANAAATLHE
jgi:succinate dehydrogenase / fumarate reductase membrane anchor subunit